MSAATTATSTLLPAGDTGSPILRVEGLRKDFIRRSLLLRRRIGTTAAIRGVSFEIAAGETVGLVGESGCGKSTTGRCVVRLETPTAGSIVIDGQDVTHLRGKALRHMRRNVQMVFQDPRDSLNDFMKVESLLREPLEVHSIGDRRSRDEKVDEMLVNVGLSPEARSRRPMEFSGGQRQRIGIARALMVQPKLLVLDEATSALDVSVQAQIINLLVDLQETMGLSYLFISHDLDIVQHFCDRVIVMYLGKVLEEGPAREVFADPAQPYTRALKASVVGFDAARHESAEEIVVPGVPRPSVQSPPSGCPFRTRCPRAQDVCAAEMPAMRSFGPGRQAACHFPLRPAS